MKHLDYREYFETDEQFANFRPLILADKKSTTIFRSASALRDKYGRAETVRKIMLERGLHSILDLTQLRCACNSDEFAYGFVSLIKQRLIERKPPCIIQCDAGKKRTGFACIVLESLSGSHYQSVVAGYLESYENNNGLDLDSDPELSQRLIETQIEPKIRFIAGYDDDIGCYDLQRNANNYLLKYGLSRQEVGALQDVLSK